MYMLPDRPIVPLMLHHSARFFEKQCGGMVIEKDMCVSFVLEESDKGPSAKDVREEDPERVARVTAKVHYGKVLVRAYYTRLPFTPMLIVEEILRPYY